MTRIVVSYEQEPKDPNIVFKSQMVSAHRAFEIHAANHTFKRSKVTGSWRGDKPRAVDSVARRGHTITMTIQMVGPELGVKKWFWVGRGTRVRYARMTPDFSAKTRVGFIGSVPGSGGFDKLDMIPRPGIQARRWDSIINDDETKKLGDRLQDNIGSWF